MQKSTKTDFQVWAIEAIGIPCLEVETDTTYRHDYQMQKTLTIHNELSERLFIAPNGDVQNFIKFQKYLYFKARNKEVNIGIALDKKSIIVWETETGKEEFYQIRHSAVRNSDRVFLRSIPTSLIPLQCVN